MTTQRKNKQSSSNATESLSKQNNSNDYYYPPQVNHLPPQMIYANHPINYHHPSHFPHPHYLNNQEMNPMPINPMGINMSPIPMMNHMSPVNMEHMNMSPMNMNMAPQMNVIHKYNNNSNSNNSSSNSTGNNSNPTMINNSNASNNNPMVDINSQAINYSNPNDNNFGGSAANNNEHNPTDTSSIINNGIDNSNSSNDIINFLNSANTNNQSNSNINNNMQNNTNSMGLSNVPSRTVYLGNIPPLLTANELLNHVRSGTIENVKFIPEKNCAFISFLDENSAILFHSDAILKRLNINNYDIRVGWGRPTPIQPVVSTCVQRYNATRNVYIGNLNTPELLNEDYLFNQLKIYGIIETIKVLSEKKIAFIHFTSIISAIRCVQNLPLLTNFKECKVYYGKDRCAFITKTQQHNAAQYLGLNPNIDNLLNDVDKDLIANALVQQSNAAAVIATSAGGSSNLGNRTIYLGNLHPDCSIEEICNVVRGGILQNIRLIKERHVCFITFIDPISAAQFYAMCSLHGLIIHNRKIKIGWGKHSGALPNSINLAVGNGASRNIYIGVSETDFVNDKFNKEKLYMDFKEFGEIEQINFFQEKFCCFINFCNISNAIKAIDGIRNNEDYSNCKINFGKDRCGNMPRQFIQNQNNQSNHQVGNHHTHSHNDTPIPMSDNSQEQLMQVPVQIDPSPAAAATALKEETLEESA